MDFEEFEWKSAISNRNKNVLYENKIDNKEVKIN